MHTDAQKLPNEQVVTKPTVKSRTLQAIKGAAQEVTLKRVSPSFASHKKGETQLSYHKIFEEAYGTVQNF